MIEKVIFDKPFLVQKKPAQVAAFYIVDAFSMTKALDWIMSNGGSARLVRSFNNDLKKDELIISSPRGELQAVPGDYVIMGVEKEFYPVKPKIFEETYDII